VRRDIGACSTASITKGCVYNSSSPKYPVMLAENGGFV